MLDYLIYGLLIYAIAKLLNATSFKLKPSSRPAAWALTILVFILSVAALTAVKMLRYQAISDSIGTPIKPDNPFDIGSAGAFAWLFFSLLNKQEKLKEDKSNKEENDRKEAFSNIGKNGYTELMFYASVGDLDKIYQLQCLDKQINLQDINGGAALMYAAKNGHEKIVELLLSLHANRELKTHKGSTALDFAKRAKNKEIIRLLKD